MTSNVFKESFINKAVTYTLEKDGKFIIVEHVPARVCVETGETLFSPETVEKLQKTILTNEAPTRIIKTPVYEYR
ncbi:hypothetical protein ES705_28756 [subsurface metagenome]